MGMQPRRKGCLIDFTFTDFFKGNHFFDSRSTNIITVQYEKKPCDDIGGSLVAVYKAVISGETVAVCSRQIKYVRIISYYTIQRREKNRTIYGL